MPRPAGYTEDDWTECDVCGGSGHFYSDYLGPETKCDECGGTGGWPADAHRHDDDPKSELPST